MLISKGLILSIGMKNILISVSDMFSILKTVSALGISIPWAIFASSLRLMAPPMPSAAPFPCADSKKDQVPLSNPYS